MILSSQTQYQFTSELKKVNYYEDRVKRHAKFNIINMIALCIIGEVEIHIVRGIKKEEVTFNLGMEDENYS